MKIFSKFCSDAAFVTKKVLSKTTTEATNPIKKVDLNQSASSIYNKANIFRTKFIDIKPKSFSAVTEDDYIPSVKRDTKVEFKFLRPVPDYTSMRFNEELGAEMLKPTKTFVRAVDISNFSHPFGSIAVSSRLNEPLSTSDLLQCAGVSFVSRKNNTQVLMHLCPTIHRDDNVGLINYIMKSLNDEKLEIGIVPGEYVETDKTIEFLVEEIKKINSKASIQFYEFPEKQERIVLKDGELKYIKRGLFQATETNPENRISYASM